MSKSFVEVILPLPISGTFTYSVPQEIVTKLQIGMRVAVQFGKRKIYTGVVHSLHQNTPELYKTKDIIAVLDDAPLLLPWQIKFWEWMADYYMASLGDVYTNAFPTALKLESDTFVRRVQQPHSEEYEMSDNAYILWEALESKSIISVSEAAEIVDEKSALPVLKELLDLGLIVLDEKLIEKYTPKIEQYVKVNILPEDLSILDEKLNRAPKQRELFFQLYAEEKRQDRPIRVASLLKKYDANRTTLRGLEDKDLVEIYTLQTERIQEHKDDTEEIAKLSPKQEKAKNQIQTQFQTQDAVLLHGVTSSGKTEIYIQLIQEILTQNKTVLYILPEISLTAQLTERIRKKFGDDVGIYHSKFNQNERVELWKKTLNKEYKIIIGARSALFLPLDNIGLIIIDEEHETSLKQGERKPYYHVRDSSFVLSKIHGAKILMGSATPSLEMYHAAQEQKIGYVELSERYGGVLPPEMEIVDLRRAYKTKRITGNISFRLEEELRDTFKEEKQGIIFQNRRGYAPIMECKSCGHTPYCPNCDVSLTYHRTSNTLKCHYCNHAQAKPIKCHACGRSDFSLRGLGTEQIAEELEKMFPGKEIRRMDADSMRKKFGVEKLIKAFEEKEVHAIVGTQMVTKGLDFEDVNLVGIIRADSLLNFPDFRAYERAFQRIVQVAGRAGRRKQRGKVIIQAFAPDNIVLQNVSNFDYKKTADEILYERRHYLYPPFVRLIDITLRHKKRDKAEKTAHYLVQLLQNSFTEETLKGPAPALIERVNNEYRFKILIKIQPHQSPKKVKELLKNAQEKLNEYAAFRSVKMDFDVDPI